MKIVRMTFLMQGLVYSTKVVLPFGFATVLLLISAMFWLRTGLLWIRNHFAVAHSDLQGIPLAGPSVSKPIWLDIAAVLIVLGVGAVLAFIAFRVIRRFPGCMRWITEPSTDTIHTPPARLRITLVMIVVIVAVMGATITLAYSDTQIIDDAYITYRHSMNLASGHGLVFNRGERIEGETNLLWALILSLPAHFGWSVPAAGFWVGVFFAAVAIVIMADLVFRLSGRMAPACAAALIAAATPLYWNAMANGLEGGLYAMLLMATVSAIIARKSLIWTALVGTALFMTRPESAALMPLGVLAGLWGANSGLSWKLRTGWAWRLALLWTTGILLVTCWRIAYYGDWMPNSVRAKSIPMDILVIFNTIVGGCRYFGEFFALLPALHLGVIAACVIAYRKYATWLALSILAFAGAVAIQNGGDWMPDYRLFASYIPLAAVPIGIALLELVAIVDARPVRDRMLQYVMIGAVTAVIPIAAIVTRSSQDCSSSFTLPGFHVLTPLLEPVVETSDLIGTTALGYISYRLLDNNFHDIQGIANRHIAIYGTNRSIYGRQDFAYTANTARPDVYLLQNVEMVADICCAYRGDFQRDYVCYRWQQGKTSTWVLMRRDIQARLEAGIRSAAKKIEWDQVPFPKKRHS